MDTIGGHVAEAGAAHDAVDHSRHRLPAEVTLLHGQQFPRCAKCADRIVFELVQAAPDIYAGPSFLVELYELPELRDEHASDRLRVPPDRKII